MVTAQPTYHVVKETDVPARMRDGTVLRADVYRPRATDPFPALVERTTYDKKLTARADQVEDLAARGYIVVVQDVRGRFASEGEFDPYYSPSRGNACVADGYDTVEWAASLPGASGAVGTLGASYLAWTQWKLAPLRPPHLKAMFVGGMIPDSRDTWPGIFAHDRQLQWLLCSLVPDTRQRLGLAGPQTAAEAQARWSTFERGKWLWFTPLADLPDHMLGGFKKDWLYWLSHHHEDWFGFAEQCSQIDVPIFHATGWYDRLSGTVDLYKEMVRRGRSEQTRRGQKLLVGPWTHGFAFSSKVGVMDYGEEARLFLPEVASRWFDYWLKGVDTGIMDEPPVRLFVMGENKWRYENEWPLARTVYTDFYCHSGGRANTPLGDGLLSQTPPAREEPDGYLYDPRDPVMSLHHLNGHAAPGDWRLQAERQDILVYQTPPLEGDVEVTGPVEARLYAASSAPDTDWTVRLLDVHPDGLAVDVSRGIVRARYRDSWEQPTLLESGRAYEYIIKMVPTSNLFRAGHRIRFDVSSSDFPNYDRNHNTGQNYWEDATFATAWQTVLHDVAHPTRVTLPIVPLPLAFSIV